MNTFKNNILKVACGSFFSLAALLPFQASAFPAERYASSSVLSSGRWVKIKVKGPGMQYVSNAQLTLMGFTDPSRVNVYGYGGRMISEILDDSHPDDLPVLPVVRTSTGLVFFGVDYFSWAPAKSNTNYSHTINPYSEASYYFLSDRETEGARLPVADLTETSGLETADSFIERLVHEQDFFAPGVSGRNLLGEDLRAAQSLNFKLPDNVGGDVSVVIGVGTNITNSTGRLNITSSNSTLSKSSEKIDGITSTEQFMRSSTVYLSGSKVGDSFNLGLSLSTSGVLNFARLDYVELEYERALKLPGDQLYFYFNEPEDLKAMLQGATAETEIWDVTTGHSPRKIGFSLSGTTASFRVESGYHEYVAFNPSKVSAAVENVGIIGTQDIHALESPDLLIISPEEYISQAERVAAMHRAQDDMTVHVVTPESLYNEFSSGNPDLSAFRKAMKMWYDRDIESGSQKIKYCLIFSRPTYDNKMASATVKAAGYPRVPIWQSPTGFTDNSSYSTDDFIGMLEDSNSTFSMGSAKINVAVGRFPVRSLEEARTAVDKLIAYTTNPGKASWRNNVMLIADDQDNGQHLDQTEKMYASLIASNKGRDFQFERLYLDNFERKLTSVGMEYPEAKKRLFAKFEEGQALVTYIGHANTVSWTHEHLLNWKDITSFSNTKLPVLYAATCEFARWDTDEYSGGEVMWAFPKTGVISMICPSRAVFINMNGPLSAQFGLYALVRNADGTPTRLGDSYRNTKNGITGTDDNKLRYALLGDPAMRMPVPSYDVVTTEIYDVDVTDQSSDLPVIEARSNPVVKGQISDSDGNIVSDFNGFIYLKLYDAEKVIETFGNGDEGRVMIYNDRKTKLIDAATQVRDGLWEATLYMPSEIENNFTQGRLTYYAVSDDGREANGATEKFYVYGYDEDAPEDSKGPQILEFFLNNQNFKDGDVTYKTPVAYATFSDESGINLSDAGIGHSLLLTLDGKTIYTDIINFYSPDLFDATKGSFTYQLPELKAGKHSLELSVWDCANNSSYATINFNVAAVKEPDIYGIDTAINADRSGVEFIINSDRPLAALDCILEVFDINGTRVWHSSTADRTGSDSSIRILWDYNSAAGNRVGKGIYICRASVTTPEGKSTSKSRKIVISH